MEKRPPTPSVQASSALWLLDFQSLLVDKRCVRTSGTEIPAQADYVQSGSGY